MLGGFSDAVSRGLDEDGLLFTFYDKVKTEWSPKFTNVQGLDVDYALPNNIVSSGRDDFVNCRYRGFGDNFAWGVATAAY